LRRVRSPVAPKITMVVGWFFWTLFLVNFRNRRGRRELRSAYCVVPLRTTQYCLHYVTFLHRMAAKLIPHGRQQFGRVAFFLAADKAGLQGGRDDRRGYIQVNCSKTVQRPVPLSSTQPRISLRSWSSARALAVRSSSQERMTLPKRQISATWCRSRSNASLVLQIQNPSA
jgi:hypothetical protein